MCSLGAKFTANRDIANALWHGLTAELGDCRVAAHSTLTETRILRATEAIKVRRFTCAVGSIVVGAAQYGPRPCLRPDSRNARPTGLSSSSRTTKTSGKRS